MTGPAADPPDRPTIGALLAELGHDARAFADAEIARYRAYGKHAAVAAAIVLALFIAAVTLVQGAVIALLIGLILWLQPFTGTGWAILVVVAGAIVLALLLGWAGTRRARRIIPPTRHK